MPRGSWSRLWTKGNDMQFFRRLGQQVGLTAGSAPLCLLYMLFYGCGAASMSFFNVYLRQLGFSGLQIGTIAGIRPVAVVLSQPLWGVAADLWGRRRMLLVIMALAGALVLGYATGRTLQFFLIWTVLYTVVSNPIGVLIDSLALDHLEGRADRSFGSLRMWGAIGWAAASLMVGAIVTGRDMRLIFVIASLLMFGGWLAGWRATGGLRARGAPIGRHWSGLLVLLRSRRLGIFLILVTLVQTGAAAIFTFVPVYLHELGASPRTIGFALTLQGLSELPLFLSAAVILRRLGPARTILIALVVFAGRTFLYSLISNPALALLVELSHGLSFSLFLVASVEYVNTLVPGEWRATGQSLLSTAYFGVGGMLGNAWGGFLYDRLGIQMMFRVNSALLLVITLLAAVVLRNAHSHATAGDAASVAEA
jgi:MFS transporter, PPP family, 3-phenylpropionic acid transporter